MPYRGSGFSCVGALMPFGAVLVAVPFVASVVTVFSPSLAGVGSCLPADPSAEGRRPEAEASFAQAGLPTHTDEG